MKISKGEENLSTIIVIVFRVGKKDIVFNYCTNFLHFFFLLYPFIYNLDKRHYVKIMMMKIAFVVYTWSRRLFDRLIVARYIDRFAFKIAIHFTWR